MNKLIINPYDEIACRAVIEEKYLDNIYRKFGTSVCIIYDKSIPLELQKSSNGWYNLNKDRYGIFTPRGDLTRSKFSCALFYYIDIAMAGAPSLVIDIGCGDHILKDIIPEVYGIDPLSYTYDEQAGFDDAYAELHSNEFECVISSCALHFISLCQFKHRVEMFAKIIKSGGRGFITFNACRMLESTSADELNSLFGSTTPTPMQVEEYIDQEIKKLNLNLLVVDNFVSELVDEFVEGNIRLVFEV